jgi:hypothetical protein
VAGFTVNTAEDTADFVVEVAKDTAVAVVNGITTLGNAMDGEDLVLTVKPATSSAAPAIPLPISSKIPAFTKSAGKAIYHGASDVYNDDIVITLKERK